MRVLGWLVSELSDFDQRGARAALRLASELLAESHHSYEDCSHVLGEVRDELRRADFRTARDAAQQLMDGLLAPTRNTERPPPVQLQSVFLSYGGPDEACAERLATALEGYGVEVWRFCNNAVPGEKLHRTMHDGIALHDRVILLCSESSLSRSGVLNEIEKTLEREAREGGADLLIPIALDDHVFGDWAPVRPDLSEQVRSRVIGRYDDVVAGAGLGRLIVSLRVANSRANLS